MRLFFASALASVPSSSCSARLSIATLVVAAVGAWACSSDSPAPVDPEGPPVDASALDAAAPNDANTQDSDPQALDAALDSNPDGAVDSSVQPTTKIIYVSSANGNDANDGLSKEKPTKSISAALAYLELKKLEGYELHICRGTYPEGKLQLNRPIVVRGEYSCVTWERAPNFGKAGNFSEANASVVQLDTGPLQVRSSNVQLEGMHVQRSSTGVAIDVSGSDGFILINSKITAGSGAAATTAVSIEKSKGVRVEKNAVSGGAGNSGDTIMGSAGIILADVAGVIEDNEIDAGSGQNQRAGSVGIRATGSVPCANNSLLIRKNRITGSGIGSLGMVAPNHAYIGSEFSLPCSVQFTDNVITNGATGSIIPPGNAVFTRGLTMSGRGGLIARNRIVLNETRPTAARQTIIGIILDTDDADVTNNAVVVGLATTSLSIGVEVYRNALLQHNTVIAAGGSARGVQLNGSGGQGVYFENNLVMGRQAGVWLNACFRQFPAIRAFRNNIVRADDFEVGLEQFTGEACAITQTYPAAAVFPGSSSTTHTGNGSVGPSTFGGSPINDAATWQSKALGAGVFTVAEAAGCAIARGGRTGIGVTTDILTGTRDLAFPSVGAWEHSAPTKANCP
jgi:hypothetical protein